MKNRGKKLQPVLAIPLIYPLLCGVCILAFWLSLGATGGTGLSLHPLLPPAALLLSIPVGYGARWQGLRWVMLLCFGLCSALAAYATVTLSVMGALGRLLPPEPAPMAWGVLCSGAGIALGCGLRRLKGRRSPGQTGN